VKGKVSSGYACGLVLKDADFNVHVPLQQWTKCDLDVTRIKSFGNCDPFLNFEPSNIGVHTTSVATSFLYANCADAADLVVRMLLQHRTEGDLDITRTGSFVDCDPVLNF